MSACPGCGVPRLNNARFCHECGAPLPVETGGGDPMIGRVIGNLRVLSVIGQGGMGKVYRAEHVKLKRVVCIKTLLPQAAEQDTLIQRFEREGLAMATLKHPNIVSVIDYGKTDDGIFYIAMEYVEGRTLRMILKEESPVQPDRAINLALQILSALDEAHANGLVHRDLKPGNVMVGRLRDGTEQVKVLDFGIAKIVGETGKQSLTQTGMMCGTPGYMAPEQILGEELDGAADLYSAGVLLYELTVGKRLFTGTSDVELAQRHLVQVPAAPSTVSKVPVPAQLDAVILKSLEKTREKRFKTAVEFKRELELARLSMRGGVVSSPAPSALSMAAEPSAPVELTQARLRAVVPSRLLDHANALSSLIVQNEKRAVHVVVVDIAGLVALGETIDTSMARELTAALFNDFAEIVKRYDGYGERTLGSSFTAVFGYPVSHEDEPERAVRCAWAFKTRVLAVNKGLPRALTVKVGVDVGTVTGLGADGKLLDNPALGELLTLVREGLAASNANSVRAPASVLRRVSTAVEWNNAGSSVGARQLFEVRGLGDNEKKSTTPLVGRKKEVDGIAARLRSAARGQGVALVMTGAAGVGKTRILDQASEQAASMGFTVARARAGRLSSSPHLEVISQLVQGVADGHTASRVPDVERRSLSGLHRLRLERGDLERLQRLFGPTPSVASTARDEEQLLNRGAIVSMMTRASAERPVALLIDDLHQIDPGSHEILVEVISRVSTLRLVVIACGRSGQGAGLLPGVPRADVVPLSNDELGLFIRERLSTGQVPQGVLDFVLPRAEGNVYFAQELVSALIEKGDLKIVAGQWALSPRAGESVPDGIHLLVRSRVDRLSPQARLLLRVGAVIGRTFPVDLVVAATEEPLDVHFAATECVEREILSPAELSGSFVFNHAAVYESVLQSFAKADLKAFHARVGEALERGASSGLENAADAMARHFLDAGQVRKALKYLLSAAEQLHQRGSFRGAADRFRQCLNLMLEEAAQVGSMTESVSQHVLEVACAGARAELMVAPEQVAGLLDPVLAVVPADQATPVRAEALRQKALAFLRLSKVGEALHALQQAQRLSGGPRTPVLSAHLAADMASVLEAKGDVPGAARLLIDGMGLLAQAGDRDRELLWQYLNQLGRVHLRLQQVPKAKEFFDSARQKASEAESLVGESNAVANLAVCAASLGNVTGALELFTESLALAEKAGDVIGAARVRFNLAKVLQGQGKEQAAATELTTVLSVAREVGWREGEAAAVQAMQAMKPAMRTVR